MGVRESCEGGGELNIHDLVIEPEKEKSEGFDAREFVTDEDWAKVDQIRDRKDDFGHSLTAIAIAEKIAFPEKFDDNWAAEVLDKVISHDIETDTNWSAYHQLVRNFIFPERPASSVNWEKLEALFEQQVGSNIWGNVNEILPILKLTYPDKLKELCPNYPVLYNDLRRNLEKLRGENWLEFARQAAVLRLTEPKRFKELNIDQTAWQKMTAALEEVRGSDALSIEKFFNIAADMQILAAKDVVFDEKGMHLVMPERVSFQEQTPPRPERKQF